MYIVSVARLLQTQDIIAQQLRDCCEIIALIEDSKESQRLKTGKKSLAIDFRGPYAHPLIVQLLHDSEISAKSRVVQMFSPQCDVA